MLNRKCTCCKLDYADMIMGDHDGIHYLCGGCYIAIMAIRAIDPKKYPPSIKDCFDLQLIERCAALPDAVTDR